MNKVCKGCSIEKALSEFYSHIGMKDGHLNKCKTCVKNRVKDHREKNNEKIKAYDRLRGRTEKRKEVYKAYAKKHRQKITAHALAWRKRNKNKANAHSRVRRAILRGDLQKLPCEICGHDQVQAHHDDYSKPLNVRWLCTKHHGEHHRIYK